MLGNLSAARTPRRLAPHPGARACLGRLWRWGRAGHAAADRWEAKAMTDRDNHRANKANVSAARAAAAEAARAARIATEEQSRRLPKGPTMLNKTSQTLALLLPPYADARRLPVGAGTAAGGSASVAGAAGQADAATRGDGPSADAVVLDRCIFDQLVSSTLRLEQVRRWGHLLIDAGLAQPAVTND
jgi:hypothetical protein